MFPPNTFPGKTMFDLSGFFVIAFYFMCLMICAVMLISVANKENVFKVGSRPNLINRRPTRSFNL